MTVQQIGVAMAILGFIGWGVSWLGLLAYGLAWSRRDPTRSIVAILLAVVIAAGGFAVIIVNQPTP